MRTTTAALFAGLSIALSTGAAFAAPAGTAPSTARIAAYATVLHHINPQLPSWQSRSLASHLLRNAAHWRLDPNLLAALVTVESRWHTHARSGAGAIGLGQLMPGTAHTLHVDPRDPMQNLSGSARYLSGLVQRYRGKANRYQLACAAYNAGPHAVARFGGIPPYAETQRYVVKVLSAWHAIARSVRTTRVARTEPAPDVAYWSGG